jgi:hypothetical protein
MNLTPDGTEPPAQPGADAWFTPGRFAALLGVLIVACFPRVVFGQETFYFRDFQLFSLPLAFLQRESFWRGQIPMWNPYSDCGLPFLAQWNTLALYPPSLFYLLFPLPWSLNIFCLAHLLFAGLGMYFLAYRWTANRLAAAVAGIAFAFNGLSLNFLMWPSHEATYAWMPWVIWSLERGWQRGGRWLAVSAIFGALQMLAGGPETILLTWVFAGGLWLAQWLAAEIPRWKLAARGAGVVAMVASLAAPQLLPFLQLLTHSQRDNSYGDTAWAMPATGLANYLVPLFHCFPGHRGVYVQHDQYWTNSYYVGVGAVALGLLAVWRVRNRRVWLIAAMALFSLLMALGRHGLLYSVLKKLAPQLGFMRFPIKLVVLATFAIPLLAAYGVAWLRALPISSWTPEWKRLRNLALLLIGLIVVIVFCARQFPQSGDNPGITSLNGLRSAFFLAAIPGCLVLLQRKTESGARSLFQTVLIILLWLDVYTHIPALNPTAPADVLKPDVMRAYFAQQDPKWDAEIRAGRARAMQTLASLNKMYWGGQDDPTADVYGHRVTLYDDINVLDHIPKLDGFYSLYLREVNTVITDLYLSSNDVPHLKDFLGIARINPPTNSLEWVARDSYAPLITAGQEAYFGDDAHTLRLLFEPVFDGRKMVCLPLEAASAVHATNQAPVAILSTNFSAQRINLQVDAAGPAMVVIAQAWYPPWHAYVDGQPTRLWRANYAFQALEVPAGRHEVAIVYQDKWFQSGCLVSLGSLFACAVLWMLPRKTSPGEISGAN